MLYDNRLILAASQVRQGEEWLTSRTSRLERRWERHGSKRRFIKTAEGKGQQALEMA